MEPVGEYCMSCLGRERMFEYAARTFGTKVAVYRLNYAVDLRYGVLYDIASSLLKGEPISVATPSFNCIWQGDANEAALRLLLHASSEVFCLNVTGPETAGVRETARRLGALLGCEPVFCGEETETAYLNNAGRMFDLMGYPRVPLDTLIRWQAQWILDGGRALGKPTEETETAYLNNAGRMFDLMGYPRVPLDTLIRWQAQWILDGGRALGKPTHFEERKGSY